MARIISASALGFVGFAFPRLLIALGVPLESWIRSFGEWLGMTGGEINTEAILWGSSIVLGLVLAGIETWKQPVANTWQRFGWKIFRRASPSMTGSLEVNTVITWIIQLSAWMRWQEAQHGESLFERFKLSLAENAFRLRAENGEILVRGRRAGQLEYEDISPDVWKSTYLDIQPDKRTLWRVTMKARTDLDYEAAKQIPDYVSLQVSEEKVYEFWPKKDAKLDALTKSLLRTASGKSLLNTLQEKIARWRTVSISVLKRLVRKD